MRAFTLEEAYEIAEKNHMVGIFEDFLAESPEMTEEEIIEDFLLHYDLVD